MQYYGVVMILTYELTFTKHNTLVRVVFSERLATHIVVNYDPP